MGCQPERSLIVTPNDLFVTPGLSFFVTPGLSFFVTPGLSFFVTPGLSFFVAPGLSFFVAPSEARGPSALACLGKTKKGSAPWEDAKGEHAEGWEKGKRDEA
jgi:hypothetical protein